MIMRAVFPMYTCGVLKYDYTPIIFTFELNKTDTEYKAEYCSHTHRGL